jgi:hypothetical protein
VSNAIGEARRIGDLALAQKLIQEQAKLAGGKVSGALSYEWALVLMADKKYGEARDVLALFSNSYPDNAASWFLIGQCSEILGDYGLAEASFRESVRAHKRKIGQPDQARSYFSLGANLFRLGRNTEAEDAWRKGLRGECTTPEARFVRSQVLLAFGEWEEGWREFESRRSLPGFFVGAQSRGFAPPQSGVEWDGDAFGRVLVVGTQGAGDVIQFSRYFAAVHARSGESPVCLPGAELGSFIGYDGDAASTDFYCFIDSLPFILKMDKPLSPYPVRQTWRRPTNPKPRVGVCWKGSSHHLNDKDRSSPIDFREALQDERWEIVSLQYGEDFKPKGYLETAELMRTLDAVVSVDTSTIHLAGTLGIPSVLIPPASPEWRWQLRDATPWYPSIEIVRRTRVDAWSEAIERAKKQLTGMV